METCRVLPVLLSLLLCGTGCAGGNRAVYTSATPALSYPGPGPVAVGVRDARPEVVSGERRETFIGFQRSLYGIPFAVQTASGKPLAQELAAAIERGLEARGVEVRAVTLPASRPREEAVAALTAVGAPRALLFELAEWYDDAYARTTLHYQASLTVLDPRGRELGRSEVAGEDDLGARQRPERRSVPAATEDILRTLLSSPEVAAALAPGERPADTAPRCTVEQILKMREAGLSREQIEAACGDAANR